MKGLIFQLIFTAKDRLQNSFPESELVRGAAGETEIGARPPPAGPSRLNRHQSASGQLAYANETPEEGPCPVGIAAPRREWPSETKCGASTANAGSAL